MLLWLTLLVLPLGGSVIGLSAAALLVMCAIEAIARRQLARFLVALVVVVIATVAIAAVALALIADWRRASGLLLVGAAVVLLVLNLVELRRD